MRLGTDKIEGVKKDDLLRMILDLRGGYIHDTGHPPTIIKMSRATFDEIQSYADCYHHLFCRYDEFANCMKYQLCGMNVVFDNDEKGVEVYHDM